MKEVGPRHLEQLVERVRDIEQGADSSIGGSKEPRRRVATGWPAADSVLGGGLMPGVHEWFAEEPTGSEALPDGSASSVARPPGHHAAGPPPLAVLTHLVKQVMGGPLAGGIPAKLADSHDRACLSSPSASLSPSASVSFSSSSSSWVVWVGRRSWPHPHGLAGDVGVLARSLWIDDRQGTQKTRSRKPVGSPPGRGRRRSAKEQDARLWAIDLAARCPAVAVVVADGSGLDMAATRRLQLAAEAGGTLVLLARPMSERKVLSAATTRWAIRPVVSDTHWPRWRAELWRCKGTQRRAGKEGPGVWLLEGTRRHGQGFVVVPANAGDRPAATPTSAPTREPHPRRA